MYTGSVGSGSVVTGSVVTGSVVTGAVVSTSEELSVVVSSEDDVSSLSAMLSVTYAVSEVAFALLLADVYSSLSLEGFSGEDLKK